MFAFNWGGVSNMQFYTAQISTPAIHLIPLNEEVGPNENENSTQPEAARVRAFFCLSTGGKLGKVCHARATALSRLANSKQNSLHYSQLFRGGNKHQRRTYLLILQLRKKISARRQGKNSLSLQSSIFYHRNLRV
jgi:hypothetical protein